MIDDEWRRVEEIRVREKEKSMKGVEMTGDVEKKKRREQAESNRGKEVF